MTRGDELGVAVRHALRRLAKAVAILTCQHEGERYAMAATAVSEVSMDPPSMLICVNQSASLYAPLLAGADFCINILHQSHEDISRLCSASPRGEGRFAKGRWRASRDLPFLEDAQASLLCRNETMMAYGTHGIFIGRVLECFSHGAVDPLIYADGCYTSLGAGRAA